MANPEHIKILNLPKQEIIDWINPNRENNTLDLSNADFTGKNISDIYLGFANLENANFKGVTLNNIDLTEANLKGANFHKATLKDVRFIQSNLSGANFQEATTDKAQLIRVNLTNTNFQNAKITNTHIQESDLSGANFQEAIFISTNFNLEKKTNSANFKKIKFIDSNLSQYNLSNSDFQDADFSNTTFLNVNFDNSKFKGTNFYETTITNTTFNKSQALNQAKNLLTTKLTEKGAQYFEFCERNWLNRYIDWEILRVMGKLPVFGASYLALFFIPLFFYILAKYNENIEVFKLWATNITPTNPEHIVVFANAITSKLTPIAVPEQSLTILLSTILLAIGSTLYTLFCPSRIKEFSRDQWVDQLGKPLIHYWPLAWRYPVIRVICLLAYFLGAVGILWVMAGKLWDVMIFIINYS